MKRLIVSLSVLCIFSLALTGQDTTYQPPSNLRYEPEPVWWQVDDLVKLLWTPPDGWVPSAIDKWIDWDLGIWDGNSIGSCMDCPWEAAVRWDAAQISMYDSVYLTKIRFMLIEPQVQYGLRVYQGTPDSFDTLFNHLLLFNLVYNMFDTFNLNPIPIDPNKDLWIGYWVNTMGIGYPLPVGPVPAIEGYGNMVSYIPGTWWPLTYINPDLSYNWSIGGYLETPDDTIIYPVFNIYRSVDNQPFEKIHEGNYYDTVYYDFIKDIDPSNVSYYVTCVYEDGESGPSDTLIISLVNTSEIIQKNNIKIFPNPAKNKVTIESGEGKIHLLSLVNNAGEEVIRKMADAEKVELDISSLPGSFYLIKTITADGMFTSKLLILK